MNEKRVFYYENELEDEFSKAKIIPRVIDEKYKYKKGFMWDKISYLVQNVFSEPIKIIYPKLKFKIKYIGREKVKPYKKQGYFIYANHTQEFVDTFIPSNHIYPKRNFFIVNPENISMKGSGALVEMLGAIPVPGNIESTKNFLDIIKEHIEKKHTITIYPEAHIWPYYTKIRNFKSVSFKYPVRLNTPVFCVTNTYKGIGRNKDKVQIVSYIDGPFFRDESLTEKEQIKDLRDRVYNKMKERSLLSDIEYIKYIRK